MQHAVGRGTRALLPSQRAYPARQTKLLNRRGHALVDYLTIPTLYSASTLQGSAGAAARFFSGMILTAVTTTKTPLGLVRVVPFRWHGRLELASVLVHYALPWLLGFQRQPRERNYWLLFASYNLLVWLLTDWQEDDG